MQRPGWMAALVVASAPAWAQIGEAPPPKSSSERALQRLTDMQRLADPEINLFISARRAEMFLRRASQQKDVSKWLELYLRGALELIQAGKAEEGLAYVHQLEKVMRESQLELAPESVAALRTCTVIGYLRLAEEENCCAQHSPESCIVPVQGAGIHRVPRGSRQAIETLSKSDPQNLLHRWLMNIAYMTLGEYPDKVPPAWLVPPSVFASEYDIGRFPDVAAKVGLDVVGHAGGAVLEDQDGDGYLDVFVSSWGLTDQLRYFHNDGNGRFTERTGAAGLTGQVGGLNIVHADYDNDGDPDLLVLRGAWLGAAGHHPRSLLRNDGDGTYTDVTEEAGLLAFHPTQTAAFGDFDNDGWLDLFIGAESRAGDADQPCLLYHNDRDGTFTECAARSGLGERGFVKGVAWGDYDNDGRLDLYVSRLGEPNRLYHNDGPKEPDLSGAFAWKFSEVGKQAGVTEPMLSFPTWFFDYDNDGWLDIAVFSYDVRTPVEDVTRHYLKMKVQGEDSRLYHNDRDGTFSDVTKAMHIDSARVAMGCNFGDLDNDGFLDAYVGTGDPALDTLIPNRMYRNAGGRVFQDVTTSGGFGHLQKGHGVAFGDVDRDGDEDIYVVMGGAYEADTFQRLLFMNPGHGNHSLTLKLEGVRSNRSAIGARIEVVVKTAEGERSIHTSVSNGSSFGGSPLERHIGLGQAQGIVRVNVKWPASGRSQVFTQLEMDRMYRIREDQDQPIPVQVKPFALVPKTEPSAESGGTGGGF